MGGGLIMAGMLSGAGQAVGKSLNDLQHTFSEESLMKERARLDDLRLTRQQEFLSGQATIAYQRSETSKDADIQRRDAESERIRKRGLEPTRIQEDVAGETERAKAQLQGKEELRPHLYDTKLQDEFDKLDIELKTLAKSGDVNALKAQKTLQIQMDADKQRASDPVYLAAERILAENKQTPLQKLQTQAEKFKVDHQEADRQVALDHADAAMASGIMKASSTEIGRLTIDLVKLESSLTAAGDPNAQRQIADIKRQIADETLWQNSARTRVATLSKVSMTAPAAAPKTVTMSVIEGYAKDKKVTVEQARAAFESANYTVSDAIPNARPDQPGDADLIGPSAPTGLINTPSSGSAPPTLPGRDITKLPAEQQSKYLKDRAEFEIEQATKDVEHQRKHGTKTQYANAKARLDALIKASEKYIVDQKTGRPIALATEDESAMAEILR